MFAYHENIQMANEVNVKNNNRFKFRKQNVSKLSSVTTV
uniref:Uncharacterized protein n=1 Tax=Anguilla anguilla TaxID=7936 RepID=A0A0E9SL89_ANGAN